MRVPSLALTALVSTLLLTACGEKKSEEAAAAPQAAEAAAQDAAGPGIDRSVAPGVAFQFDYSFTLPAKAITGIQREHAAACARLGVDRCRVTGMAYEQPREGEVEARLDFLLAPDIAQAFAADGISAVEKAEGKLDSARVNGENAGDAIKLSQQDSAGVEAEIKRIEQRLAGPGLTKGERIELQQQVAGLQEQLRGNAQDRRTKEASIASTPVSFAYASEGLIGGSGTFGKAASASWSSAQSALSFVMLVLGIALPWVGIAALAVLAWRALRRRKSPVEPVPQD